MFRPPGVELCEECIRFLDFVVVVGGSHIYLLSLVIKQVTADDYIWMIWAYTARAAERQIRHMLHVCMS
jgi:hypothetical protein